MPTHMDDDFEEGTDIGIEIFGGSTAAVETVSGDVQDGIDAAKRVITYTEQIIDDSATDEHLQELADDVEFEVADQEQLQLVNDVALEIPVTYTQDQQLQLETERARQMLPETAKTSRAQTTTVKDTVTEKVRKQKVPMLVQPDIADTEAIESEEFPSELVELDDVETVHGVHESYEKQCLPTHIKPVAEKITGERVERLQTEKERTSTASMRTVKGVSEKAKGAKAPSLVAPAVENVAVADAEEFPSETVDMDEITVLHGVSEKHQEQIVPTCIRPVSEKLEGERAERLFVEEERADKARSVTARGVSEKVKSQLQKTLVAPAVEQQEAEQAEELPNELIALEPSEYGVAEHTDYSLTPLRVKEQQDKLNLERVDFCRPNQKPQETWAKKGVIQGNKLDTAKIQETKILTEPCLSQKVAEKDSGTVKDKGIVESTTTSENKKEPLSFESNQVSTIAEAKSDKSSVRKSVQNMADEDAKKLRLKQEETAKQKARSLGIVSNLTSKFKDDSMEVSSATVKTKKKDDSATEKRQQIISKSYATTAEKIAAAKAKASEAVRASREQQGKFENQLQELRQQMQTGSDHLSQQMKQINKGMDDRTSEMKGATKTIHRTARDEASKAFGIADEKCQNWKESRGYTHQAEQQSPKKQSKIPDKPKPDNQIENKQQEPRKTIRRAPGKVESKFKEADIKTDKQVKERKQSKELATQQIAKSQDVTVKAVNEPSNKINQSDQSKSIRDKHLLSQQPKEKEAHPLKQREKVENVSQRKSKPPNLQLEVESYGVPRQKENYQEPQIHENARIDKQKVATRQRVKTGRKKRRPNRFIGETQDIDLLLGNKENMSFEQYELLLNNANKRQTTSSPTKLQKGATRQRPRGRQRKIYISKMEDIDELYSREDYRQLMNLYSPTSKVSIDFFADCKTVNMIFVNLRFLF